MNEEEFLDNFLVEFLLKPIENREMYKAFLLSLVRDYKQGHLCYEPSEPISLPSSLCQEPLEMFPPTPIVRSENRYYFQKNWVLENSLIQETKRLCALAPPAYHDPASFFKRLEELQTQQKVFREQAEAVSRAFSSSFSVICGGPGTGKTYTAGHLVRLLAHSLKGTLQRPYRVFLAAPTGKAALHLKSSLLAQGPLPPSVVCESFTLHRMLKMQPGEMKLRSGKRIDADLILVDEASMIDASLLAHLMEGIGNESRLILMGDPHQLPPIQAGAIFSEMADLFGVFLKKCARTEDALLQRVADAILRGDEKTFFDSISLHSAWDESLADQLSKAVQPLISWERPDPSTAMRHYNQCRILNALRQGPYGTDILNRQIFQKMEESCKWGQWWAAPILSTVNNPKIGLYNGTPGILIGQKKKGTRDRIAYFPDAGDASFYRIPPYDLAFCISIHKSQGSEFEEVVALFPQGSENFGREALYTAATRAKKGWSVRGEREILRKLLSQISRRKSGFTASFVSRGPS